MVAVVAAAATTAAVAALPQPLFLTAAEMRLWRGLLDHDHLYHCHYFYGYSSAAAAVITTTATAAPVLKKFIHRRRQKNH